MTSFRCFRLILLLANMTLNFLYMQAQNIQTFAGGGQWQREGGLKTNVEISPGCMAYAPNGELYFTDARYNAVRKISSDGTVTTIAGTGVGGYTGDGGPARDAQLNSPYGLVFDKSGNLYVTERYNNTIRKITPAGIISTFAGGRNTGLIGDGGPAAFARIGQPGGIAIDTAGNIYVCDYFESRIRKINTAGIISTFAGDGTNGYNGDNIPATSAKLYAPIGLCIDKSGNLFVSEYLGQRIRKVDTQGKITTVAGTGVAGFSGDGALATSAQVNFPWNITVDDKGDLYIADVNSRRIRRVDSNGIISTFAGNNSVNSSLGDGGLATEARLSQPWAVLSDKENGILIADVVRNKIRRVDSTGIISTFAGNGMFSFSGDGGKATAAELSSPTAIAFDKIGNCYIADQLNSVIRKVDKDGIISIFAGNGLRGYSGDGGQAAAAMLDFPRSVYIDAKGEMYIVEGNRIRKISTSGIITTIAGGATAGFSGDGGLAVNALLNTPYDVVVDTSGNLFINDASNYRIRKVTTDGIIQTIAGNGVRGYGGDGGFATDAMLNGIRGMAMDKAGNLLFVDQGNYVIRKINSSGIISTVAGNGTSAYSVDGTKGNAIRLGLPIGIAIDAKGAIYYADYGLEQVRKITDSMTLVTVTGTLITSGFSGDGGPAKAARISRPFAVALDAYDNLYFSDYNNNRIRKVYNCNQPRPIITPGDSVQTICQDDAILLQSSSSQNNQWLLNNTPINGSTSASLSVKAAGTYSLQVFDSSAGCPSLASNTIKIKVNSKPDATLALQGATTFCEGGMVAINVKSDTSWAYQWFNNGQSISGAQGGSYFASKSGSYKVSITNRMTNCQAVSAAVGVVVNPIPPKPVISFNGSQLASSIATGNQWFLNGSMISGATAQQLTPQQNGEYTVMATVNGCVSVFSEKFIYMPTAVNDLQRGEWLRIGPNPIKDRLYFNYQLQQSPVLYVTVYNAEGQVVSSKSSIQSSASLNVTNLRPGVYLLKMETDRGKRQFSMKFVKL